MAGAPTAPARTDGLAEAAALWWRKEVTPETLRRDGRRWTAWSAWIVVVFATPGVVLLVLSPLTLPVALICFAHAWLIPLVQARRGGRSVVPMGSERGARRGTGDDADRVALGLLGDLMGHAERELAARTGLVLERGALGIWLVGERGALMVRRGGRRVDCWCVRVGDSDGLPGGDRVAHLLLALREDERGFAKVANLGFSGAAWRVRRWLPEGSRPALDAARAAAREGYGARARGLASRSA
jgi:hypothetical protein